MKDLLGVALDVSPDCDAAKHTACIGRAWSEPLDAEVPCACPCHPEWSP